MEKKSIKLESKNWIDVKFEGETISINPYIDLTTKIVLIENYMSVVNDSETRKYFEAEYGLILGIVDLCTDIDITTISIDDIISSGLWERLQLKIDNYDDLRQDIKEILARQYQKNSIDMKFAELVEKAKETLQKISNMDFSKESVDKLLASLNEEKNKLNDIIPVVKTQEVVKKNRNSRKKME